MPVDRTALVSTNMAPYIGEITAVFVTLQFVIIFKCIKSLRPDIKDKRCYKYFKFMLNCGPVFSFLILSIIVYFLKLLKLNFGKTDNHHWTEIVIHSFFAVYIWINVTFNYLAAMLTKPGKPPKLAELNEMHRCNTDLDFCKSCERLRNYGTHHCDECNTCVRMLCHHSYFVNNCIGLTNFAYYFCFLCYAFVGLVYGLIMTYAPFYACIIRDNQRPNARMRYAYIDFYTCQDLGELPLIFIAVAIALMVIFCLLIFHITLLAADLSLISFRHHIKSRENFYPFLRSYIRKCCMKHRRVKLLVLLKQQKRTWKRFLWPTFSELPRGLIDEELSASSEYYEIA